MPVFEYRCRACGEQFEWLQTRASDVPSGCPSCRATDVARQLSVFAVTSPRTSAPAGPCGSADCACRRAES